ncbi:hypothetical protein FGB62_300g07 [Gracilaria domingensis]|nr:hypothetical protein FGB62_300g07 [Gracilaria domingensis]
MFTPTPNPARSGFFSRTFNASDRFPKKKTKRVDPKDDDEIRPGPAPSTRANSSRSRLSSYARTLEEDDETPPVPPRRPSNRSHFPIFPASRERRNRRAADDDDVRHISTRRISYVSSSAPLPTPLGLSSQADSTPLPRRSGKIHRVSGCRRTRERSFSSDETLLPPVSWSSGAHSSAQPRSKTRNRASESNISFERQLEEGEDAVSDEEVLDGSDSRNASEASAS